jgi:hypothetical protein
LARTPSIMTEFFHGFPQSMQPNIGIVPVISPRSHPFLFIIHLSGRYTLVQIEILCWRNTTWVLRWELMRKLFHCDASFTWIAVIDYYYKWKLYLTSDLVYM